MKIAFTVCLGAVCFQLSAQDTKPPSKLEVGGYIDFYYGYYSDNLEQSAFQKFATVAPRSNEFSLNIAQVSVTYTADKLRTHATVHYGDIPSSSWSSDFNFIQQAYVGYRVAESVWIDAGLFTTHIGTEALLPKDNKLSTLAVGTYHEPYYQSGVSIKYDPGTNLVLSLHLLNGYNNFLDNNGSKSAGVYARYQFSETISATYSNLVGQETQGTELRFYNNAALVISPSDRTFFILGADYCNQKGQTMSSGMAIAHYNWTEQFSSTLRGEFFNDPEGFISGVFPHPSDPLIQSGLVAQGITLGLEFKPTKNSYVRAESRRLSSSDKIQLFNNDGIGTRNRTEFIFTTGIWF